MSDVLLPGIDDAPAPSAPAADAPAAPPASTPRDDSATQSASVDTGAPTGAPADPAESAPAEGEGKPEVTGKGVGKKINRLTSEIYEAQRQRDALAQQNERLLKIVEGTLAPPAKPAAQPQAPAAPKPEEFASYGEYLKAEARYEAAQVVRQQLDDLAKATAKGNEEQQARQAVEAIAQGMQRAHAHITESVTKAASDRFPDLLGLIDESTASIPPAVQVAMARAPDPAGVAYYLMKNESVIDKLAGLNAFDLGAAMVRISHAMTGGQAQSTAPAPGKPSGTRGGSSLEYPSGNVTPEQHRAWKKRVGATAQAKGR